MPVMWPFSRQRMVTPREPGSWRIHSTTRLAARKVADLGASLIVCPANNMHRRETAEALKHMHNSVRGERCRETGLWLISADVTGERDGRISWSPTAVLNPAGEVVAQLPLEKTGLLVFDIPCRL